MALSCLRLRRCLSLSTSLLNHYRPPSHFPFPSIPIVVSDSAAINPSNPSSPPLPPPDFLNSQFAFQSRLIRSSSRSTSTDGGEFDEITPDTILFEGCDYNHWLITVDFPKDPKPTREEMIETYVQTAAKVFGSVEEAKKRIYALSTTTYQGFQVECSEETSNKFKDLPGVVFVLPDSYIDPVNKEYGGDKYINGEIIPRPPPIQYGRQRGDRNREPRYRSRGEMSYQQGNSPSGNQGYRQQNYGPPQSPPSHQNYGQWQSPPAHQNYGPPSQSPPVHQNYAPPPHSPTAHQNYGPPQNFSPVPPQQNYGPQQNFQWQNHGPSGARGREGIPMNNTPGGWNNSQNSGRDSMASSQAPYNQGQHGNYYPQGQRDIPQGEQRSYAPSEQRGFMGQSSNYASPQVGGYGRGPVGPQGQGIGTTHGQNFPRHGEDQRFSQVEQTSNRQDAEPRNYTGIGNSQTAQGRY